MFEISRLIWIEDLSFMEDMTKEIAMWEVDHSLKPLLKDKRPDWKSLIIQCVSTPEKYDIIFADDLGTSLKEWCKCNYNLASNERSMYWDFFMEEKYSDIDWDKEWESAEGVYHGDNPSAPH